MTAAVVSEVPELLEPTELAFSPWKWGAGVTLVCAFPLLLMGLGVDFSTELKPLLIADTGAMNQSSLGEAVHAAARGNYTHTLLEWSATASAVFLFALAMMQFRLTRESTLMIIGIALLCAGAMDAFHTLAADRLITSAKDLDADDYSRLSGKVATILTKGRGETAQLVKSILVARARSAGPS